MAWIRTIIAICVEFCATSTTKHSSARDLEGLVTSRWLRFVAC
jgi:multidrug transporter EmrE-like cation transporter